MIYGTVGKRGKGGKQGRFKVVKGVTNGEMVVYGMVGKTGKGREQRSGNGISHYERGDKWE